MTNIKLSKRLLTIANMVNSCTVLADIGCDHALLDIYLIQNKIVKRAIACDINEGALNQARRNIVINNVKGIELRLADGLSKINDDDKVDTLVISGLGNQKIYQILNSSKEKLSKINNIIIQSNTSPYMIRKDLCKLGYHIEDEKIVKDNNIIYVVIKFGKGLRKYSKSKLFFGPVLLKDKDDLFKELFLSYVDKNKIIIKKLPTNKIVSKIKLILINKYILLKIKKR